LIVTLLNMTVEACARLAHDGQKGSEPVFVVDQRIGEGAFSRAASRANDEVDVRHFVAIANQRLANHQLMNLSHANSSRRSSQTTFVHCHSRRSGLAILVISIPPLRDRLAG
jgi:hypothetical protein